MQTQTFSSIEKKQFSVCFFTFFCNGAMALSIGALLPFLRDTYGLDYAFAGLLVSLHSVGNLISSFAAGLLPLWIGRKKSIVLFSAFYAGTFVLITSSPNNFVLAAAFVMSGLARGAVSNFNNTAINEIAPGKAWTLNTMHAMFAVGAFLAPIAVLICTAGNPDGWRIMCYIMLGLGVLELLSFAWMPLANDRVTQAQKTEAKGATFLREKQFWICTGTLFFYLCAEQGVIGWMVTYFQDSGLMSAGYAQVMASVLWILILAGRLTAAYLSTKMNKGHLLGLMGVGFIVFFIVVLLGRSLPLITLGIAGFGFSMAGIYPTTVSLSGGTIKAYPLAWSTMLTTAGFGAILMPVIIGAVAEKAGIYAGMSTVVIAVLITCGFIFANLRMHRNDV